MITRIRKLLLRWRQQIWLLVALGMYVITIEIYFPNGFNGYNRDFLIFGVVVPVFFVAALTLLARGSLEPVGVEKTSFIREGDKHKQHVLLVENDLLLGAGIETLLSREPNIEVIGISSCDVDELIERIRYLRPEVIILDEAIYLSYSSRLLVLLHLYHKLRLIIVSTDDNLVHIYDKKDVLLTEITDLVNIVHQDQRTLVN